MGSSRTMAGRLLLSGLALAATARADEWDVGGDADNAFTTDNLVAHGAEQVHDLAPLPGPSPDQDWFLAPTHPFSSHEFVVDGTTGELDLTAASVQRMSADGAGVLQNALVTDFGGALSLTWTSPPSTGAVLNLVRVQGAACGTGCNGVDRYRARFYDTTYTIPRFNNSGTQSTVLLIQNATDGSCNLVISFFERSGALLEDASIGDTLGPRGLLVVNTLPFAGDQSGSVRVAHTCGYGGLSGKAVSVEPATGFTFDTAMVARPR